MWETHDHEIKRNEDPTLGPVRLGICRNVVDEEASANEEDDFEEILNGKGQLSLRNTRGDVFITEEQGHGLVHPPAKEGDQRHPKKQKLDAQVDRARLSEEIRRLWRREEASHEGTEEEHDGDGAIGGEGHDWEEDDAEPPMIGSEHACKYMRAGREGAYSSLICDSLWTKVTLSTSCGERSDNVTCE
jgi:hypothetical protein